MGRWGTGVHGKICSHTIGKERKIIEIIAVCFLSATIPLFYVMIHTSEPWLERAVLKINRSRLKGVWGRYLAAVRLSRTLEGWSWWTHWHQTGSAEMRMPYASLGTHWANSVGRSHQTSVCLEHDPVLTAVNESLPLDGSGNWIRPWLYPWDSGFTPEVNFGSSSEWHPNGEGCTMPQTCKIL